MSAKRPKVAVVGSFMMDLVVKAERRPRVGETLVGEEFGMFLGGKGTNQAIAAARLGAEVHMIGRLGQDQFGIAHQWIATFDVLVDILVVIGGMYDGFACRDWNGRVGPGKAASHTEDHVGPHHVLVHASGSARTTGANRQGMGLWKRTFAQKSGHDRRL